MRECRVLKCHQIQDYVIPVALKFCPSGSFHRRVITSKLILVVNRNQDFHWLQVFPLMMMQSVQLPSSAEVYMKPGISIPSSWTGFSNFAGSVFMVNTSTGWWQVRPRR